MGTCSVPWLKEPSSFQAAAKAAVDVCNALVHLVDSAAVAGPSSEPSNGSGAGLHTIKQLDAISDTLCKVLDVAEFVRQNHGSDGWREAAEGTYRSLASYMHMLNTHTPLHAALKHITTNAGLMATLTEEQQRMAVLLQREFEREGIHLSDSERAVLVSLNDSVHEAGAAFQGNIQALSGCS